MLQNFRFITHIDTHAVVAQLYKMKPHTWKGEAARGEPKICRSKSILLRQHKAPTQDNWLEDLPLYDNTTLEQWPSMQNLLKRARAIALQDPAVKTLADFSAPPGRVMLCGLGKSDAVQWHTDNGPYHTRHMRFHVPLITNPLCYIHVRHEQVHMEVGSLWLFNNGLQHSATNWGEHLRVHLIFEMPRLVAGAKKGDDEAL